MLAIKLVKCTASLYVKYAKCETIQFLKISAVYLKKRVENIMKTKRSRNRSNTPNNWQMKLMKICRM